MEWLTLFTHSLFNAAVMLWEMLWALVLGFSVSAALQVFVSKEKMANLFGRNGIREVSLALGFGAASSSCSFGAAATMKTIFKKGAAFMPSIVFLIASTNLVIELGIVIWALMGWRFVLAEAVGCFVMVGVIWIIFAIHQPTKLIEAARNHSEEKGGGDHCCGGSGDDGGGGGTKLKQVADAFFMDWSMVWKEIVIGVLIAGFVMTLVPKDWWQHIFLSNSAQPVRLIENAIIGPLIAMFTFVCSCGNIPLASVLWASGATFGGVIAFIYGDLIVLPLISAYRKYYGLKAAAYITLILFVAMVVAGILVDLLFSAFGLIQRSSKASAMAQTGFFWNYTTWLDIIAIIVGGVFVYLHFRNKENDEDGNHENEAHDCCTNGR